MTAPLTDAEINHLRRLLGWVRCEIGQSPEELVSTVQGILPAIPSDISEEGKARMVLAHQQAANVPKYVRAAVKALEKTILSRPTGTEAADIVSDSQGPLLSTTSSTKNPWPLV